MASVDLIVNCYQKNYKTILNKRFINNIKQQNQFNFSNVFIVINNINNRIQVRKIAGKLKDEGIINDYFFVKDYLDKALKITGLRNKDLKPISHYTDWALVSLYVAKSKYLLHWDPDVYLEKSYDWISDSLRELEKDKNYLVSSPLLKGQENVLRKESYAENENFLYSDGFSDQIFLIKRKEFLRPIYRYSHIYSLRFPLAEFNSTFEKRIDSFMKRNAKTILINKKVKYIHPKENRTPYPRQNIFKFSLHYFYMIIIVFYYYLYFPLRDLFQKNKAWK